ncbi:hypothetical protein SBA2_30035 [Acidobacteriia bacterium SbA2]|nr:hypothetical protein SBA2_30035 [Acidobacteriia bacterium SbA2]
MVIGKLPSGRNENQLRRYPRESGGPLLVRSTMASRFRGNDVIFESASREPKNHGIVIRNASLFQGSRLSPSVDGHPETMKRRS